jgi:hypothetical protein
MRRTLLWLLVIGCPAATGCARNHYQVRMTPTDSGFERTLTCWTENAGQPRDPRALSDEALAKIQLDYGWAPEPGEDGKNTFQGQFAIDTPQDVGGVGRLERINTSLGTLWVYVERFRGNDDLESELTKRREAVDTLVDLTLGWLRKEFCEEANFQQLEAFVDKTVRNDLKNLAVYLWVAEANSEDLESNGFLERLWLFAHERDYLTLHDIAVIIRAEETGDPALVSEIVARMIARELEIEPTSDALSIFGDADRLSSSWNEHIRGSEYYRQYVRRQQGDSKTSGAYELPESVAVMIDDMKIERGDTVMDDSPEPDALLIDDSPEPGDAVMELLLEAFIHFDLASGDMLEVTLAAEAKPISTNGTWNEAEKTVTWSDSMWARPALPTVCSATWAVPNAEEQRRRFGEIVLAGQDLAGYAMWVESLSDEEAKQWDKLLATCKPDEPWQETIRDFQFAEETPAKEFLAAQVKSLLIEGDEEDE